MQIYEEVLRLKGHGKASAIATIVECKGSAPQKQGAKMLVRDDGSILGTLGGGCLEADVIRAALASIRSGSPLLLPFDLTEREGGLVCGGKVAVFIEPAVPEPRVMILGAGHIARALSLVARFTGFKVTVLDDRPEFVNRENIPDADERVLIRDFKTAFDNVAVREKTFIVVATRGHIHDLDATRAAIKTPASFIGLVGSSRKKGLLFQTLRDEGCSQEDIGRVVIPVGMDIGSVTPEEIAVSIMGQIIQRRRNDRASGFGAASGRRPVEQDGGSQAVSSDRE